MEETLEVARKELEENTRRYRKYANIGKKSKSLKVGDKVLILLPTSANKLLMNWQGPYEVTQRLNDFDYRVKVKGKEKLYHANLLRKYVYRADVMSRDKVSDEDSADLIDIAGVAVVDEEDEEVDTDLSERET